MGNAAVSHWAAMAHGGLLAVLWPAYQYAFLVYCERTPGLRLTKLEVTRFDGAPAREVCGGGGCWLRSVVRFFGAGLCLVLSGQDQLSWHDRITRTHLAP